MFVLKERRDAIYQFIAAKGEVTISELVEEFSSWSEMTIRRDLAFLEQAGRLILTRGGARILPGRFGLTEDIYSERERRNYGEKQQLATKAAALVEPGKSIYIDAGTTAMALARALPDCHLVVVTGASNIALEIARSKELPSVVQLGGTLNRKTMAVGDPDIAKQLESINIDTAFVAASGFDEKAGFSVGSQLDALGKRAVISRARRVVMMLDSSKCGVILPFTFAGLSDVDLLVLDDQFPEDLRARIASQVTLV